MCQTSRTDRCVYTAVLQEILSFPKKKRDESMLTPRVRYVSVLVEHSNLAPALGEESRVFSVSLSGCRLEILQRG